MGFSITQDKADKINKLRAEGRLCGGPTRTRAGCTTRATWYLVEEVWTHNLGVGKSHVTHLPVCKRHALQMPQGYCGVNFRVLEATKITKGDIQP